MTISRLTNQFLCTTSLGARQVLQAPDVGRSAQTPLRKKNNKYLVLEPRMLFDGAIAVTAAEVAHDTVDFAADVARDTGLDSRNLLDALYATPPDLQSPAGPTAQGVEIAFIDSSVNDIETLIADFGPNVEIYILNNQSDGLDQIAAALKGRSDVAALHIVSHGEEAKLILGNATVDSANLATHADDLAIIKSALTLNGDILLYGCDVGNGTDGAAFLDALAAATQADVAASTDATGSSDFGGNWDLEIRLGLIDVRLLDAPEWRGILAPMVISTTAAPVISGSNIVWQNAGTVGGTSIDLVATIVSSSGGFTGLNPFTAGDNPTLNVTTGTGGAGEVVVRWSVFAADATHSLTIPTVGSPNLTISDLDGTGSPYTLETIKPSLNGLTSYTVNSPTGVVIAIGGGALSASGSNSDLDNIPVGTSALGANRASAGVTFSWSQVSTWVVTYRVETGNQSRNYQHDGDGDFAFTSAVTTTLLSLDLDGDNSSTATGTAYTTLFTEGGAAVSIGDTDVLISQNTVLGTTLGAADIVLTNAQTGDTLAAVGLPLGITATVDASVAGVIKVHLAGSSSVANYQTAINAIVFSNSSDNPAVVNRLIEISVTNTVFGTTSAIAVATIQVDAVNDAPTLVNDSGAGTGHAPITVNVLANDFDVDGTINPTTVQIVGTVNPGDSLVVAGQGTWSVNATIGALTFTPLAAFNGAPTPITYTVADNLGLRSNPAAVSVIPFFTDPHLDLSGQTPRVGAITYPHNGGFGANPAWVSPEGLLRFSSVSPEAGGPGLTLTNNGSSGSITGVASTTLDEAIAQGEFITMSFTTLGTIPETWLQETALRFAGGRQFKFAFAISNDGFQTAALLSKDSTANSTGPIYDGNPSYRLYSATDYQLQAGQNYELRAYIYAMPGGVTATGTWDDLYILYSNDPTNKVATFTEGDAPVGIASPSMEIEDTNNPNMVSGMVTLTNAMPGDTLLINNVVVGNGDTNTFNGVTYTVTVTGSTVDIALTGSAPKLNYQMMIAAISFQNPTENPDPTDRIINAVVNDGLHDSNVAQSIIHVVPVNDAPIVDLNSTASAVDLFIWNKVIFNEGGAAINVADSTAADVRDFTENDIVLMKITLSGVVDGANEFISIAGHTFLANADQTVTGLTVGGSAVDISYVAATGVFTITNATGATNFIPDADLDELVRGVTYLNAQAEPTAGDRTLSFVASDATLSSAPAVATITVQNVNDAPVIAIDVINPGDVFVVDSSIADAQSIVDSLPAGSNIVIIPQGVDGLYFLAGQLAGKIGITNLHIISHGEPGVLHLGTASLTAANMGTTYGLGLALIGSSLSGTADILVYGCNFGQDPVAMTALANATSADVAASVDNTGSASLGGNWTLEVESGTIETQAVSLLAYSALLAPPTIALSASLVASVPTYMAIEDTTKVLSGISFADPDAGTANVSVTISVVHGTLDLNSSVLGGVTAAQVTGDLSGNITITAPLAAINATLASATGLVYTPTLNYFGTDVLTTNINDLGNSGQGGPLSTTATANIVVQQDTDGDGVINSIDIDDDNDGILDTVEGYSLTTQTTALDFIQYPTHITSTSVLSLFDGNNAYTGNAALRIHSFIITPSNLNASILQNALVVGTPTNTVFPAGSTFTMSLENDDVIGDSAATIAASLNAGLTSLGISPLSLFGGTFNDVGTIGVLDAADFDRNGDGLVSTSGVDFSPMGCIIQFYNGAPGAGGTVVSTSFSPIKLLQAGGVQVTTVASPGPFTHFVIASVPDGTGKDIRINELQFNGQVNTGAASISSAVETSIDSDSDGFADYLDIDSDNDGITDNVEAQTTAGYIAPSGTGVLMGDTDHDGLDNVYDAATGATGSLGLTPVNTDGADKVDYLDADSDNDGKLDITERGDGQPTSITSTTDTDHDGLFDIFEAGTINDGFDVNDTNRTATTLNLAASPRLNAAGSNAVPMAKDLLFRMGVDTDGDGIANIADIDDDNDGILDTVEIANAAAVVNPTGSANLVSTQVIVEDVVFLETFGAGPRTSTPYTTYYYENGTGSGPLLPGNTNVNDGEYAIASNPTSVSSFFEWQSFTDHTGDPGGRMLIVNAASAPGEFYRRTITSLEVGQTYQFSSFIRNIIKPGLNLAQPNVTFEIQTMSGTILASVNTGSIAADATWHDVGLRFNIGSSTAVQIVIRNDGPGGGGNDLVIDDISFSRIAYDTDSDGIADHLDIDSDKDGITDNVEAQTTAAYIAPSGTGALMGDADGDGLDDVYDSTSLVGAAGSLGLTPVNTDSADVVDYLDADSDNDGKLDIAERGDGQPTTITSTIDTDQDGLFDIFEAGTVTDGFDVNDANRTQTMLNLAASAALNSSGSNAIALTRDLLFRYVNRPPLIDLNSTAATADTARDTAITFTEGDPAKAVALVTLADVNDVGDADLTKLTIVASGNVDGTSEKVGIAGVFFDLATTATQTATVGSTNISIAYDATSKTFTVTNATGATTPMDQADLDTLIRGVTYENTSQNPTAGLRTLKFTVTDSGNLTSPPAIATITVVPVNDPPVDGDELVNVTEDTPLIVAAATGLLANTVDPDGGTLTITGYTVAGVVGTPAISTAFTIPGKGDVTINVDGSYSFLPVLDYFGPIPQITYTVSDGLASDTSTLDLTVTNVNDAPIIDLNSVATAADSVRGTDVTFTEGDTPVKVALLAADVTDLGETDITLLSIVAGTNPDGTAEKVVIAGQTFNLATSVGPIAAIVGGTNVFISYSSTSKIFEIVNAAGATTPMAQVDLDALIRGVTYENTSQNPTAGARTLSFTATDASNAVSAPAVATITVVAVNDPPVDGNEIVAASEDVVLIVPAATGLLANTVDPDGLTPSIVDFSVFGVSGTPVIGTAFTIPSKGDITIYSDGSYTFAPALNFNGPIPQITYTVIDGAGGTDTSKLDISVTAVNDPPILDLDANNSSGALLSASQATYTEGGPAVKIADGSLITDLDNTTLSGATIVLTNAFAGDVLSLGVLPGGIVGTVNTSISGQITVTLSNTASLADYQAAIDAIAFSSTSQFPNTTDRNITVQVNDGGLVNNLSNIAVSTLKVIEVNDPPTVAVSLSDQSTFDGQTITIATLGNFSDPDGEVLHFSLGAGTPIWITIDDLTGVITAVPPAGASIGGLGGLGAYDIKVIATDSHSVPLSTSDVFRLTVTNLPPVAVDDHPTAGAEDITQTGNVISGIADPLNPLVQNDHDTAPDSDVLTVSTIAGGTVGTLLPLTYGALLLTTTGVWTFTPNAAANALDDGEMRTEMITYQVSDGNGGFASATLTITINGTNDAPVAVGTIPNAGFTDGQTIPPINVTTAFNDVDIEPLTYTATGLPLGLSLDPTTGLITGILPADASQMGPYTVVVTAFDGTASTTQTFQIGVANLPPVAVNDKATVGEDVGLTLLGNVISGIGSAADHDTLPDADPLRVSAVNGAATNLGQPVAGSTGGTFVVNADGAVSFNPGLDFQNLNVGQTRDTTITYKVSDGQGGFSDATVTVTVTGSNDAPVSLGPIAPVTGVDGQAVAPIDVGSKFVNPLALPLTYTAAGLPLGLIVDPATGIITGTFANNASVAGPYIVKVTATAPDGSTASIPVDIIVTNPLPKAVNDGAQTPINTPVVIAVLANDLDPDHDVLSVASVGTPLHGTVVINPDGTLKYTPALGFVGPDSFTYTVTDSQGGTSTATVNVNVGAPNLVTPVGTPLPQGAGTDGAAIAPINVATNFSDPNSDPLTYFATGLPPGLTLSPAGQITGTPPNDASAHGPYTVYVTATDPAGNQVTLPMVITISNPTPAAVDDSATTAVNTPVTLNLVGNDTDPDHDLLAVTSVTQPAHGTVVINLDGTVKYTPATGYSGPDTFIYSVSDGQGGVDIATVTLNVGGTDLTAPTATAMPGQLGADGAAVSIDVKTLAGVTDPNTDPLVYSAVGLPPGLSIDPATGIITGTLPNDASAIGPYMIQVFAADPSGTTIGIPFLLTATNPAPSATADHATTQVDQPITISVLANDIDPDKDVLAVAVTGAGTVAPLHGTVSVNPDGTVKYTPAAGFSGTDTFTYKITDAQGTTSTAVVTIDVGVPASLSAPPAAGPIIGTDGETITPVPVAALFADPDNANPSSIAVDLSALPPGISYNPLTKQFEGTADKAASQGNTPGEPQGTYVVAVTATDSGGAKAVQYITFTFANLPPVANDDGVMVGEDGPALIGNVIAPLLVGEIADADTAPDSDPLSVISAAQGLNTIAIGVPFMTAGGGMLTMLPGGGYTFDPGTAYNGLKANQTATETISYTVSDGNGLTDIATLTITITGANDKPVIVDPHNPGPDPTNPIPADPNTIVPVQTVTDGQTFPAGTPLIALSPYAVDPENDPMTFTTTSPLPQGLTLNADGTITGTIDHLASQGGDAGHPGHYTITVLVSDGTVSTPFTVVIDVSNPPPVAKDDMLLIGEDAPVISGNVITPVLPGDVADADTPPDSDVLTVVSAVQGLTSLTIGTPFTTAGGGVLTLLAGGGYTFNPGTAYNGLDTGEIATEVITYTVSDGNGGIDTATLTITINGSNDAPVPVDPHNPGPDPHNPIPADPNTIVPVQMATDGQVFTAGSPLVALGPYIVDPDAEPVTFTTTSPLPAGLTLNPDGTITGTVDHSASQGGDLAHPGRYTITVMVSDGTATVALVVVIDVSNPSPVAVPDTGVVGEDAHLTLMGNVTTGLGADHDMLPDADPLTVAAVNGQPSSVGQPVHGSTGGTFIVNADGTWSFDPGIAFQALNAAQSRTTVVTYRVADGQGGTAETTITVTVNGAADAPVSLGPIAPVGGVDGQPLVPIDVGSVFNNPTALPLTYVATNLPAGLVIDPNTGIISGVLQNNASVSGPYIVNVTAIAPDGSTATIPVEIVVTNPAPTAINDTAQTAAGTSVVIAPLANDSDPDHDPLSIVSVGTPSHGTVTVNPDGTVIYTPTPGYTGPDSFTYSVTDSQGGTSIATVNVNVGVPDGVTPTVTPIAPATGVDGSPVAPINVVSNFTDPNGDPLIFTALGLPPGLSLDPSTGIVTGTLPNDASTHGPYTVYITAVDPSGNQVTLPMVIVVANLVPTAVDDLANTPADTPVTFNVVGNDTDPDKDALHVSAVTQPAHGSVAINADGTVTYTPALGYTGPDMFTYTVSDGQGGLSIATVTLGVGTLNPDAPVASPMPGQPGTDGAMVSIDVPALASIIDPNGDALIYSAVGLPAGLVIDPVTGVISGTLANTASVHGPYTIQVFGTDPSGASVGIPFVLTVANPSPAAHIDMAATPVDQPVNIAVLANDTDLDHDTLSIIATTSPVHGTVLINADGTLKYTPTPGYVGPDFFNYTISDGQGGTSNATVTIEVGTPTSLSAPPAVAPTLATDGQTITPVALSAIFADPDKIGTLTISVDPATLPSGISYNSITKQFEGTAGPAASQGNSSGQPQGTYVIPVIATDDAGLTTTSYVTFTFTNLPPVANNDTAIVSEDGPAIVGNVITDVGTGQDHDTLPDSDLLSILSANQDSKPITVGTPFTTAGGGILTLLAGGGYTFEPGTAYNGLGLGQIAKEVINYVVSDGNGGTAPASFMITINGANDKPVIIDPNDPGPDPHNPKPADPNTIVPVQTTTDGQAFSVGTPLIALAPYAVDPEGDAMTFSTTSPLPPGLTLNSDGTITGTVLPSASQGGDAGLPGRYTVTVLVSDGTASTPLTVVINVANLPPVAVDDHAIGDEDHPQSGNVITDLVTGDHDTAPDTDPVTVAAITGGTLGLPIALTYGTLLMDSLGNWTFTPNALANALPVGTIVSHTVTYTVSDGNGGTDTATLAIDIKGVNDVPVGLPLPNVKSPEGSPVSIPTGPHFVDPDTPDVLTFTATGLPPGLAIDLYTGLISGTPHLGSGSNTPYTLTVFADDGHGGITPVTFLLTIDVPTGLANPPHPQPPLLDHPHVSLVPVISHEIGRMISKLGHDNSLPDATDHIITRTVQSLSDTNAVTDFDDSNDKVHKLVEWLAKQGRDPQWIEGLFDTLEHTPYLGDSAGLALSAVGAEQFRVRSLMHDGALFIGIDETVRDAQILSITEVGYSSLPDFATRVGSQDVVINRPPTGGWINLSISGRMADGRIASWTISVNMDSSEVLTGNTAQKQAELVPQKQRFVQAAALQRPDDLTRARSG